MSSEGGIRKPRKIDVAKFMQKLERNIGESKGRDPLELVLVLLYAGGGKAPSKLHVQKALFIASKHIKELGDLLEFKAYRMGPWSEEVGDALESAVLAGLASLSEGGPALTQQGVDRAKDIWDSLDDELKKVLADVAEFVNKMSEDELLLYTYTVYGEDEKSEVKDQLLRRRKELAEKMLLKGLVSTGLAAEIAGEPLPRFIEYLKKKGVKPFAAEVGDIEKAEKL
mgnify:CR=1 FL=1